MTRSRTWSLGTALIAVLVLAVGYMTLISPQRSHTSKLRDQTAAAEQQNAQLQTKVSQLKRQEANKVKEQARIQAISQEIPSTSNMAPYVLQLQAKALAAGVDLLSIAPGKPAPVKLAQQPTTPSASPSGAPSQQNTSSTNALTSIPLKLDVAGDFFQIQQFLKSIEDLPRASEVTDLQLAPGGARTGEHANGTDSATDWQVLKGTLTVDIFMTAAPLAATAKPSPAPSPSL